MTGWRAHRGAQRVVARAALIVVLAVGCVLPRVHADEAVADVAVESAPIGEPYASDEVIVVCEPLEGQAGMLSHEERVIGEALGYEVSDVVSESPDGVQTMVASVPENMDVQQAIAELETVPGVIYAQPNYEYDLIDDADALGRDAAFFGLSSELADSLFATNDPYCVRSGNLNQWYLWDSGVARAWDYARSDSSVAVAVLDTGCRLDHEDLAGVIDVAHAFDTYENVPLSSSSVVKGDAAGHGTHVCGIVGAQANNDTGIAGASYNAAVIPIKVFSNEAINPKASTADIVQAYDYLRQLIDDGSVSNLRVVNMSLGYYSTGTTGVDRKLEQSIGELRDRGVLTVCAGGNGDARGNPRTDRMIPSDFDVCMSVTPLDRSGGNLYWADYNQYKDISAPGELICSTSNRSASGYETQSGTSMAAPIVAGTACLLWAADPGLSVGSVEAALLDNVDPIRDMYNDRSAVSGSKGALNAEASVRSVLDAKAIAPEPDPDQAPHPAPEPVAPAPVPAPDSAPDRPRLQVGVKRLAGPVALDTMAAISVQGYADRSCDTVVLATVDGYWDALTASSVAGLSSCPILLTAPDSLSPQAANEIRRLGAKNVVVAGGSAAVSEAVEDQARAIAGGATRMAGRDAVRTALEVYRRGVGSWGKTAVVATSATYHDALAASPYSYSRRAPIFLTNPFTGSLDPDVVAAIREGGFERVLVCGGSAAVSPAVEQALSGIQVVRKGGPTAYETSVEIANWCLSEGMRADGVGVASASGYWDALAGGALCGRNDSVLVLADDASRMAVDSFVAAHAPEIGAAYVFGGSAAVSPGVYDAVCSYVERASHAA